MPRKPARKEPVIIETPTDVPVDATHFRLRRQGKNGPECTSNTGTGLEKVHHPVEWFTTPSIVERWGYDDAYYVQFSRVEDKRRYPIGQFKRFRLRDPNKQELDPNVAGRVAPAPTPTLHGELDNGMSMLLSLKAIVDKDSAARIAAAEASANASVQIAQASGERQVNTLLRMFELFAPKPSGPGDEVKQLLGELVKTQNRLALELAELKGAQSVGREEEEEEEEEEDDNEEARAERFIRAYRKKGGGFEAVKEYLGEESILGIMRMLPTIKAKLPEFVAKYGSLLQEQMNQALQAPPPAAPAPVAQTTHEPIAERPRKRERTNGATMPAPREIPPDEHAVNVE